MRIEATTGLIRDTASWAVQISDADRILVMSAMNQAGINALAQLGHILQRADDELKQNGMGRENVVEWSCQLDSRVSDAEFFDSVFPRIAKYFEKSDVKPAVTNVMFGRLLNDRLIQLSMTAMA